eukprot:CAMPEP_0179012980 /NCGR_PEP_ID=MMETSP0796-20121207/1486_1 /TAXON_ID=73915 /ORGANISM="Pyrodinium bahamense, Strain pbaha01" /LENGTH=71 /DNA_ID=CAMNT_0020708461 /DNA_START=48 /DNA_END=263 /DNA_ORIENTATION=+
MSTSMEALRFEPSSLWPLRDVLTMGVPVVFHVMPGYRKASHTACLVLSLRRDGRSVAFRMTKCANWVSDFF